MHLQLQRWPRFQLPLGWSLFERYSGALLRILQTLGVGERIEGRMRNAGTKLDSPKPASPNFLKGLRTHSPQIQRERHRIHMSTYIQREKNQDGVGKIVVPKRYIRVLVSGTSEGDLIWKQGLCKYK